MTLCVFSLTQVVALKLYVFQLDILKATQIKRLNIL